MKNMSVKVKLVVGFSSMLALCVLITVIGCLGMSSINKADDGLYRYNVLAISAMGEIRENLQNQRAITRNMVIHAGDAATIKAQVDSLNALDAHMEELFVAYENCITDKALETAYYAGKATYEGEYETVKQNIIAASAQDINAAAAALEDPAAAATITNMVDNFSAAMASNDAWAQETVENNTKLFVTMLLMQIGILLVAAIIAVLLTLRIALMISKPLRILTGFMQRAGEAGDLNITPEEESHFRDFSQARDEVGVCVGSCTKFVNRLLDVGGALETVANGDLTADLALLSESDSMGKSLHKMIENLNHMFSEIHTASAQVSIGSKQIADGAQSLAQGSTQQASAVQELSASISDIAEKTKANAAMATNAASLARTIMSNAEKGSHQMDQMMDAVKEINHASQNISKVIKVIDDIAFQTNILALNAAVEAARAGQHGKGFAVVAEEVRSLAAKSAEAAKETGGLIANSMEKAELGSQIAGETAQSLSEIVSGINESTRIVTDIARSSDEQAMAIDQVNTGIDQVAQVVQQNSATAEESAAASQEMSGQSDALEELVSRFKLKEDDKALLSGQRKRLSPPKFSSESNSGGGDYGKY